MDWDYSYRQPPHSTATSVQQGAIHKEPNLEDFTMIKQLFQFEGEVLNITDVRFTPLEPSLLELSYSLEADDKEALKLTPNQQLSLFPEE